MRIPARALTRTLTLATLLAMLPAAGFAADGEATSGAPAVEPAVAVAAAQIAETPAGEPADAAIAPGFNQYGDCALWCGGPGPHWHYGVSRETCCSGSLTCPDGSSASGFAFYPYQGFAEFCSV